MIIITFTVNSFYAYGLHHKEDFNGKVMESYKKHRRGGSILTLLLKVGIIKYSRKKVLEHASHYYNSGQPVARWYRRRIFFTVRNLQLI